MSIIERLAERLRHGQPAVLVTVIRAEGSVPRHEGTKMLVYADGRFEGTVGGGELEHRVIEASARALKSGQLERLTYAFRDPEQGDVGVCGGEMEVLVEPHQPPHTIVIVGAGHVGQAVAHLAKWVGFHVVVVDDRPDFAQVEVTPEADEIVLASLGELADKIPVHQNTHLLLTTRGVEIDVEALPKLLDGPAAYIGVIGSRRRWQTTVNKLRELGVAEDAIQRVHSPMGLELNAETPEEIAVSIIAEIVMLRRGGDGDPMARPAVDPSHKGS